MIPVLRPQLPKTEAITPYLRQIDANRWYSNLGPLVGAFEERLSGILGIGKNHICVVANGTLGLTVALQALEVPRGSLCLMPSWTFTATPAAALAAGLHPCFLDVEAETMMLSPERVKVALKELKELKGNVGAVIAVSAFGAAVDVPAWDRFTEETGIPVVIDAAAAFDAAAGGVMKIGRTPVMISLHATKAMGIGEGGLVVSRNPDTVMKIRRIINFGFEEDRRSHRIAINAKLPEYGAAIGLAALDTWKETREAWVRVREAYIEKLRPASISLWLDQRWISSTCNIIVPGKAQELAERLEQEGIETRRWWLTGCHAQPAYRVCSVYGELSVTQWLGQSVLGLPTAVDMPVTQIGQVCDMLMKAALQAKAA